MSAPGADAAQTFTIGQVAERTGFAPATLRYYDQLGLVSPAARADNGYRRYDDGDLGRLQFVSRAKQLGCSLDEIAVLIQAYDGGECGPVQDELRTLVAAKIAGSQHRLLELTVLIAELQRAAAELDRHRPVGACDDRCGCVSQPMPGGDGDAIESPVAVSFGRQHPGEGDPPIACSLAPDAMPARMAEFRALFERVVARRPIERGVRLELDGVDPGHLAQLVAAEHACCSFWEFAITIDGRGLALEVSGPEDARPLIDALFGVAA